MASNSLTIRIPDVYRQRLEQESTKRGRTINQQIIKVLEIYFAYIGYESDTIISNDRAFEVLAQIENSTPLETLALVGLVDKHTDTEVAAYIIGVDQSFFQQLRITSKYREMAVLETAKSLIRFHLRRGADVKAIRWNQFPEFEEGVKRVIKGREIPSSIDGLETFLQSLKKDEWTDQFFESKQTLS